MKFQFNPEQKKRIEELMAQCGYDQESAEEFVLLTTDDVVMSKDELERLKGAFGRLKQDAGPKSDASS